jgi:phosphoheptose isomerase
MHDYIEALKNVRMFVVDDISRSIYESVSSGNSVYLAGNGGAMSIMEHFASDLLKGANNPSSLRQKIHCLGENQVTLTALANDCGYDAVFKQMLVWHNVTSGDVVIAASVSGTSVNVVNMLEYAASVGAKTVLLSGFKPRINVSIPMWVFADGLYHKNEYGMYPEIAYAVSESVMSAVCHEIARQYHGINGGGK